MQSMSYTLEFSSWQGRILGFGWWDQSSHHIGYIIIVCVIDVIDYIFMPFCWLWHGFVKVKASWAIVLDMVVTEKSTDHPPPHIQSTDRLPPCPPSALTDKTYL